MEEEREVPDIRLTEGEAPEEEEDEDDDEDIPDHPAFPDHPNRKYSHIFEVKQFCKLSPDRFTTQSVTLGTHAW